MLRAYDSAKIGFSLFSTQGGINVCFRRVFRNPMTSFNSTVNPKPSFSSVVFARAIGEKKLSHGGNLLEDK
jgi:hypothetical protein